ncbi:MAG TPA: cellulase family glycosylhydrolase [Balneolaceae bacterium]
MRIINILVTLLMVLTFVQCDSLTGTESNRAVDAPKKPSPLPEVSDPVSGSFVSAKNGNFVLNGERFHFSGTNAYYLPNYQKINPQLVSKTFDLFKKSGIKVVRMWGFYDGPPQYNNDITIQPKPGQYNEQALRYLDKVIAQGKKHGIRFIITLTNFWKQLGGIRQYNEWDGHPNAGMKHFINDPDTQRWYKDYIKMLLNRTNTVTGVKYKNSPAIFSWEIINEGRLPKGTAAELRDWYQEIARYIKSIDSNHMVATGEEGFDEGVPPEYSADQYSSTYVLRAKRGTSYKMNTAIPEIDYGTAHWYPTEWGLGEEVNEAMMKSQRAWINDHVQIAENLGKPFVLGEYGFPGWGNSQVETFYYNLWDQAERIKLDGSLLWQLTADKTKCKEYGGNICWPGGRGDEVLYNEFVTHTEQMNKL